MRGFPDCAGISFLSCALENYFLSTENKGRDHSAAMQGDRPGADKTMTKRQKRAKFLAFLTGMNIAFLFFSATYVAFSGQFIEAALYASAVLASAAMLKHPHMVRQGLSFA
jgi:hypothetical protein